MFLLPQLKTDTTWLKYAGSFFVDMNSYPQFGDLCEVVKCCVETVIKEKRLDSSAYMCSWSWTKLSSCGCPSRCDTGVEVV